MDPARPSKSSVTSVFFFSSRRRHTTCLSHWSSDVCSSDLKLAGTTVFVSGHAYSDGSFSTRTSIIDLQAGKWLVEDLETFLVRRKGQQIHSPDFNFWGVTDRKSVV